MRVRDVLARFKQPETTPFSSRASDPIKQNQPDLDHGDKKEEEIVHSTNQKKTKRRRGIKKNEETCLQAPLSFADPLGAQLKQPGLKKRTVHAALCMMQGTTSKRLKPIIVHSTRTDQGSQQKQENSQKHRNSIEGTRYLTKSAASRVERLFASDVVGDDGERESGYIDRCSIERSRDARRSKTTVMQKSDQASFMSVGSPTIHLRNPKASRTKNENPVDHRSWQNPRAVTENNTADSFILSESGECEARGVSLAIDSVPSDVDFSIDFFSDIGDVEAVRSVRSLSMESPPSTIEESNGWSEMSSVKSLSMTEAEVLSDWKLVMDGMEGDIPLDDIHDSYGLYLSSSSVTSKSTLWSMTRRDSIHLCSTIESGSPQME